MSSTVAIIRTPTLTSLPSWRGLPNARSSSGVIFAFVMLVSALYMAKELKRGWIPWDEGTLAQSAERIEQGEMPHRDFDDVYTGGLAYLNAGAFRLFGENLSSIRYVFYFFFLTWIPCVYWIASRFASPPVSGALTILAMAWGPPNYAAAMPSWYNLFCATFGLAALLRYVKVQRSQWMFAAGLFGGVSFLFKVSGLFYVGGVLLFLLFRAGTKEGEEANRCRSTRLHRCFVLASVVLYETLLFMFLRRGLSVVSLSYFFVPALLLGSTILWREYRWSTSRTDYFKRLSWEVFIFGLGIIVPITLFLVPYVLTRSLSDFARGVFVLPARRFSDAAASQSTLKLMVGAGLDAVVIRVFCMRRTVRKIAEICVIAGTIPALVLGRILPPVQKSIFGSVWALLPVTLLIGAVLLMRPGKSYQNQQQLFLVLSVTAGCSLIQFPFIVPTYFCYVAPLVVLTVTAVCKSAENLSRPLLTVALCFCLLYVVLEVTPGFLDDMGQTYVPDTQNTRLTLPRGGGIRVSPGSAQTYTELERLIGEHAHGQYIYATPDCPEVYFLYGFRNPTRTLFDFFDDPGRTQRILAAIRQHDVNLVVINLAPSFSHPVSTDLRVLIEQQFPNHAQVHKFEVRWKP